MKQTLAEFLTRAECIECPPDYGPGFQRRLLGFVVVVAVAVLLAIFLGSCAPTFALDMRDPQAIRERALMGGWEPERRLPEPVQAQILADCQASTAGYPAGAARHPARPEWLTVFCTFGRPITPVEAESICMMISGPGWKYQSHTDWTVECRKEGA